MNELIGRKLGQYEITGVLGEGGMATVFRAYQTSVRRDVAIKIIESKLARNPEFVRRFQREAMTIAALDHPHILKIHDFGREDDLLYLVMELKSGGSLAQKIRTGQLSAQQVARYLDQISEALDHAHGKGIIHRDLKPQNVLLDTSDNTFLTDFGIAKLISGDSTALTAGGMAMGTPGYMAPEQWYGQQIDARTDLYALAGMVYEMLTGRVPFTGDTPATLMYQHLNEPPPPLSNLRSDLPASLEKVLIKAMAKQPDQRFQSAGAFAHAFREGMAGVPPAGVDLEATLAPITPLPLPSITPLSALEEKASLPKTMTETAPRKGGRSLTALVGVAALALILIGAIALMGQGGGQTVPTSTKATEPVIAANPSNTISPTATGTFTPVASTSAVASLTATNTVTLTPSMVSPNARTALANAHATQTKHAVNASPTASPDQRTALAHIHATQTKRAANATPTPLILTATPDQRTALAHIHATQTKRAANATASRTPTPMSTRTPTVTAQPTSVMSSRDGAVLLLRENFDDKGAMVQRGWYTAGEIKPIFVPGQISLQNPVSGVWGSIYHALGDKASGVLYLFKPVSNAGYIAFSLDSGTWQQKDFRSWGFDKETDTNQWHFFYRYGRTAGIDPEYHEVSSVRLVPNQWYYLALWTNGRGEGLIKVWQSGANTYLLNTDALPIGSEWTKRQWSTAAGIYDRAHNALFIDTFEILSFPQTTTLKATLIPSGASTFSWKPIENSFNGLSMMLVPAGCFQMGSDDGKADQQPVHEVCLSKPFWISKTEVTNADFRRFVIAGGYRTRNYWTPEGWAWKGSRNAPQNCGSDFSAPTQPRVCISWYEAQAFAAWWGGRLPTEAEWEYAARGPQGSVYPWGDYFVDSRVVFQGNSGGKPAAVGSLLAGKSWVGALDMGGNVWEWVRDWYDEDYYKLSPKNDPQGGTTGAKRVIRGGAWNSLNETAFRAAARAQLDPSSRYNNRGFRIVKNY